MLCLSSHLSGHDPIERDSHKTDSVPGTKIVCRQTYGNPECTGDVRHPLPVEFADCQISLVQIRASESRKNECRWFRGMGTVLAGVADREVIESSIHDLDSFVRMSAANQDQTELEASLGIFLD